MLAQVVGFDIDEKSKDTLLSVIDKWRSTRGQALAGCNQVITCIDKDNSRKGCVVVLFDDQAALDTFSKDEESQALFKHATSHATKEPSVYEAHAHVHGLT